MQWVKIDAGGDEKLIFKFMVWPNVHGIIVIAILIFVRELQLYATISSLLIVIYVLYYFH